MDRRIELMVFVTFLPTHLSDSVDVTGHNKMQTTFVTDENELGKEGESHERGPKDRKKC